jgi:hypothetical protein
MACLQLCTLEIGNEHPSSRKKQKKSDLKGAQAVFEGSTALVAMLAASATCLQGFPRSEQSYPQQNWQHQAAGPNACQVSHWLTQLKV